MGYDVSLCLDHDVLESDPTLLCPACSQILLEPQKPECGHVHCKACLKKLRRCKLCDSMIEKHTANSKAAKARDVVPVLLLSKLGNLTVRCAQHCDAVFRLKEYELHCLKQCSKSLVPCTNRPVSCDQLVPRYLMRDHLDNDCLYRPVKCNVCGFRTVYCNLYLHERSKRCAQLATRKSENEQHNAMSVKVKRMNEDLSNWSKWSQYNYVKQTDVKRDFIATLYSNGKLQNEIDINSPQYRRMLRYEQTHSANLLEHDEDAMKAPSPNTLVPKVRSKMLPRRANSDLIKPTRLYICQRCDKVHTDSMPRSHKECRWHVGPLLLNTFGSTCSTCKRPSYQIGCQFGRHVLLEINPNQDTQETENELEHSLDDFSATALTQTAISLLRNPSVSPIIDDPVFITQTQN